MGCDKLRMAKPSKWKNLGIIIKGKRTMHSGIESSKSGQKSFSLCSTFHLNFFLVNTIVVMIFIILFGSMNGQVSTHIRILIY